MKFKNLVAVCLCLVLAGCSTTAGVSKGNIFYSEGNPNVTIQVDSTLRSQEPFSYETLTANAGPTKNTIYPFGEIVGEDLKRALFIAFMDRGPTMYSSWAENRDWSEKNLSGVIFRVSWTGRFADPSIAKEVTKRGFRMKGQYSAVQFVKVVNQTKLLILAYIEKTPDEFLDMYWDREKLSPKQKAYMEQLELRATEALTVTSYSVF